MASSLVSISLELSESLSDSEPDELDASSLSSLAFDAAFNVCFCLLSGSGDVERLELLSLSDDDEAAMAAMYGVPQKTKLLRCDARVVTRLQDTRKPIN